MGAEAAAQPRREPAHRASLSQVLAAVLPLVCVDAALAAALLPFLAQQAFEYAGVGAAAVLWRWRRERMTAPAEGGSPSPCLQDADHNVYMDTRLPSKSQEAPLPAAVTPADWPLLYIYHELAALARWKWAPDRADMQRECWQSASALLLLLADAAQGLAQLHVMGLNQGAPAALSPSFADFEDAAPLHAHWHRRGLGDAFAPDWFAEDAMRDHAPDDEDAEAGPSPADLVHALFEQFPHFRPEAFTMDPAAPAPPPPALLFPSDPNSVSSILRGVHKRPPSDDYLRRRRRQLLAGRPDADRDAARRQAQEQDRRVPPLLREAELLRHVVDNHPYMGPNLLTPEGLATVPVAQPCPYLSLFLWRCMDLDLEAGALAEDCVEAATMHTPAQPQLMLHRHRLAYIPPKVALKRYFVRVFNPTTPTSTPNGSVPRPVAERLAAAFPQLADVSCEGPFPLTTPMFPFLAPHRVPMPTSSHKHPFFMTGRDHPTREALLEEARRDHAAEKPPWSNPHPARLYPSPDSFRERRELRARVHPARKPWLYICFMASLPLGDIAAATATAGDLDCAAYLRHLHLRRLHAREQIVMRRTLSAPAYLGGVFYASRLLRTVQGSSSTLFSLPSIGAMVTTQAITAKDELSLTALLPWYGSDHAIASARSVVGFLRMINFLPSYEARGAGPRPTPVLAQLDAASLQRALEAVAAQWAASQRAPHSPSRDRGAGAPTAARPLVPPSRRPQVTLAPAPGRPLSQASAILPDSAAAQPAAQLRGHVAAILAVCGPDAAVRAVAGLVARLHALASAALGHDAAPALLVALAPAPALSGGPPGEDASDADLLASTVPAIEAYLQATAPAPAAPPSAETAARRARQSLTSALAPPELPAHLLRALSGAARLGSWATAQHALYAHAATSSAPLASVAPPMLLLRDLATAATPSPAPLLHALLEPGPAAAAAAAAWPLHLADDRARIRAAEHIAAVPALADALLSATPLPSRAVAGPPDGLSAATTGQVLADIAGAVAAVASIRLDEARMTALCTRAALLITPGLPEEHAAELRGLLGSPARALPSLAVQLAAAGKRMYLAQASLLVRLAARVVAPSAAAAGPVLAHGAAALEQVAQAVELALHHVDGAVAGVAAAAAHAHAAQPRRDQLSPAAAFSQSQARAAAALTPTAPAPLPPARAPTPMLRNPRYAGDDVSQYSSGDLSMPFFLPAPKLAHLYRAARYVYTRDRACSALPLAAAARYSAQLPVCDDKPPAAQEPPAKPLPVFAPALLPSAALLALVRTTLAAALFQAAALEAAHSAQLPLAEEGAAAGSDSSALDALLDAEARYRDRVEAERWRYFHCVNAEIADHFATAARGPDAVVLGDRALMLGAGRNVSSSLRLADVPALPRLAATVAHFGVDAMHPLRGQPDLVAPGLEDLLAVLSDDHRELAAELDALLAVVAPAVAAVEQVAETPIDPVLYLGVAMPLRGPILRVAHRGRLDVAWVQEVALDWARLMVTLLQRLHTAHTLLANPAAPLVDAEYAAVLLQTAGCALAAKHTAALLATLVTVLASSGRGHDAQSLYGWASALDRANPHPSLQLAKLLHRVAAEAIADARALYGDLRQSLPRDADFGAARAHAAVLHAAPESLYAAVLRSRGDITDTALRALTYYFDSARLSCDLPGHASLTAQCVPRAALLLLAVTDHACECPLPRDAPMKHAYSHVWDTSVASLLRFRPQDVLQHTSSFVEPLRQPNSSIKFPTSLEERSASTEGVALLWGWASYFFNCVSLRAMMPVVNILLPRVNLKLSFFHNTLSRLFTKILVAAPHQTIWQLAVLFTRTTTRDAATDAHTQLGCKIMEAALGHARRSPGRCAPNTLPILTTASALFKALHAGAVNADVSRNPYHRTSTVCPALTALLPCPMLIPTIDSFALSYAAVFAGPNAHAGHPLSNDCTVLAEALPVLSPYASEAGAVFAAHPAHLWSTFLPPPSEHPIPLFAVEETWLGVGSRVLVFTSKARPKRISAVSSSGRHVYLMLKYEDKGDMRRDARTIEVVGLINRYVRHIPVISPHHP
jgi:hypothetical protein